MIASPTMRLAVTGANSAVGRALLRLGARDPAVSVEVVAAVRSAHAEQEIRPLVGRTARIARVAYDDAASLRAAFEGASAVAHLVGVLVERPGATYEQAHVDTTRRVAEAARERGVDKLVLVSAVGADETSANRYWRTKGQAEAAVRAAGLAFTVLRVPLLLGRDTEGAAALRRHTSRATALLVGGGRTLQQPLDVDDLARAILVAARPGVLRDRVLDLVGPVALPDRQIVERAAGLLGRRVKIRSVPAGVLRLLLALRQRLGRSGFSPDALEVVTTDTRLDPAPAARALGLELTGLDAMIEHSLEEVRSA